jgi:hypothetical protein
MRIKVDHEQKALLTFQDAAARLGVCRETLVAAARRGQVATVELNKRVWVIGSEVDRLLRVGGGALK